MPGYFRYPYFDLVGLLPMADSDGDLPADDLLSAIRRRFLLNLDLVDVFPGGLWEETASARIDEPYLTVEIISSHNEFMTSDTQVDNAVVRFKAWAEDLTKCLQLAVMVEQEYHQKAITWTNGFSIPLIRKNRKPGRGKDFAKGGKFTHYELLEYSARVHGLRTPGSVGGIGGGLGSLDDLPIDPGGGGGSFPAQTGHAGEFLTTDGSTLSWAEPLPDQTGHAGQFLTTDGSTTSWTVLTLSGDLNFVFNQVSASATWTIAHNLGKFPSVSVLDSGGNSVVGTVTYTNGNNLVLSFSAAFSGTAYLN